MFKSIIEFRFIEKISGTGKNSGKPFQMVKLANPNTFENFTFFSSANTNFPDFNSGDKVCAYLTIKDFGGNLSTELTGLELWKS